MIQTELELKLTGAPSRLKTLPRHKDLKSWLKSGPRRRKLVTTYFDTADHWLERQGMVWRVRKSGRTYLQSLKIRKAGSGGVLARALEIEFLSKLASFDPAILSHPALGGDEALRDVIAHVLGRADFGPRFATIINRTLYDLGKGRSKFELAIDLGVIEGIGEAQGLTAEIAEAEIEHKAGPIAPLFDVAGMLARDVGLTIEPEPKAQRGYRLLRGAAPQPRTPKSLALDEHASVDQALQAVLGETLGHLAANGRAFVQAPAAEGVHQIRVALRRARAALSLFKALADDSKSESLRLWLRGLGQVMAGCRDLDVFVDEILPPVVLGLATSGQSGSLDPLVAAAEAARGQARARAVAAIQDPSYVEGLIAYARHVETAAWRRDERNAIGAGPARDLACAALEHRLKRLIKSARGLENLVGQARHGVRIELKKLRYGGAFLESLFARKTAKAYLSALADLQDRFGALNDAFVAEGVIAQLIDAAPEADRARLAYAGGLVVGFASQQASKDWRKVVKSFPDFLKKEPFWRVAA